MRAFRRAGEFSLSDVRRCIYAQPGDIPIKECRVICRNARLRYLTRNPLRTLQSYKAEMEICLDYGNPEAHYVEGIKHYFGLRDARKGLRHLQIAATNNYDQGNYLLGLIKLVTGEHDEGMEILDTFQWQHNTHAVDKFWRRLQRSLRDVPIVRRRSYGINRDRLLPPRTCILQDLANRCTTCFYYKEVEKFMQMVHRG